LLDLAESTIVTGDHGIRQPRDRRFRRVADLFAVLIDTIGPVQRLARHRARS
jgi:hypothetical protein